MPKIKLSSGDHWNIYIDDHERYKHIKTVNEEEANWRHGFGGYFIFKDKETGKLYSSSFRDSSNEMNSWDDMNYGDQEAIEVKEVQKTITTYEPVEDE